MNAVTYQELIFAMGEVVTSINSLYIEERPNEHGQISIVVILDSKKREQVLHESSEFFSLFYLKDEQTVPLFQGVVTFLEIETSGDVYYLKVQAKTATYFMDFSPRSRSYQDVNMGSHNLIQQVLENQKSSKCILTLPNEPTKELVVQYEETDWEFLKRFVSRYGACIFVSSSDTSVKLQIGLSQADQKVEWDNMGYTVSQNMEYFNFCKDNDLTKGSQWDCMQYHITAFDIVPLGYKVMFHGKEMYVGGIVRSLEQGLLLNEYTLFFPKGLTSTKYYNDMLTGCSINGIVMAVKRNRVQVVLQIDSSIPPNPYWFPFSTVAASSDGSGWYCMPKEGDQVRIFFPVHDEREGYAITCIEGHTPETPAENDPMGNPNSKNISTPDGNDVKFTADGILLSTNGEKGKVLLTNDGSITINGTEEISFWAGETIQISADNKLDVSADSKVIIMSDGGGNITITEDSLDISGTQIHENVPN